MFRRLTSSAKEFQSMPTDYHIVEAFGADRRYRVNIIDREVRLDDRGVLLSTEQAGVAHGSRNLLVPLPLQLSSLEHQFIPEQNGTRYESRLMIGVDSALCPLFIGYVMARAWLKHNVEEVGNFEFFLPALYRVSNG